MPIRSAIVLAGGHGRRMWPFATVRNKAAMPVANTPNVRRIVDALHAIGISRVAVVLGPHPGSVRSALLGASPDLLFVTAEADAGTAGAALAGMAVLDEGPLLLVYGDTVTTPANLRAVCEAPEATGAAGAALIDPMPHAEGGDWYAAAVEDGRLAGIVGHDADATCRLCGVFALDRSLMPYLEANPGTMRAVPVGGMPPPEPDLAQSLNDWPADIAAVNAVDFVVDMDKPWHVLEANARVAAHLADHLSENRIDPSARVHDGAEITGFVQVGPGSVIGNRVLIEGNTVVGAGTRLLNGAIVRGRSVIGDETRVSDYCLVGSLTVVGSRCVVGHGAEIDGVMLDGAYLYHYCEISGLVGQSVDIGAATVCGTLRFDDGPAEHRVLGRRERPREQANATYYGDHSRTGVNVITMPGAKIGAYSCVGAGVVVYQDVPDRTLMLLKQDTVQRPWGPERYGW